ncbi:MAG: hypothetical protein LBK75_00695 [Oscillospiraceae bacterium]|jgi:hypothetical protein|nr:hypothetical protein [Oscillospiraceae bacterium]
MRSKMVRNAALIVLIIGIAIPVVATAAFASQDLLTTIFPRNDDGQTYGSGYVENPADPHTPDLILAEGIDGEIGYAYQDDLHFGPFEQPKTAEECALYNEQLLALAYEQQANGDEYLWYIPLYESDGKTIIGQYGVGNPGLTIEWFASNID